MGQLIVINHVTLDGVMQGPARPGEDERDGFAHSGWAAPGAADEMIGQRMAEGMRRQGSLLLGRRTYEQFAAYWPQQSDNPYTERLNATHKYVATRTLTEPSWQNTTLLTAPDIAAAVGELKREQDLTILGSGELIRSLLGRGLIDQWILLIHPRVLGTGRRLFEPGGPPVQLELVEAVTAATGVIMATYRGG